MKNIDNDPRKIFGSHIEIHGSIKPLSANSSPAIRKDQYTIKKIKLKLILIPRPFFLEEIPRVIPIKTKTIHANGIENFL